MSAEYGRRQLVPGQKREAQVLEQQRAGRNELARAKRLALHGSEQRGRRVFFRERMTARQKLVEHDAEREQVGAVIDFLPVAARDFGRQIAGRAAARRGESGRRRADSCCLGG